MPVKHTLSPQVLHLVGSGKLKVRNRRLNWCLPDARPQTLDGCRLSVLSSLAPRHPDRLIRKPVWMYSPARKRSGSRRSTFRPFESRGNGSAAVEDDLLT